MNRVMSGSDTRISSPLTVHPLDFMGKCIIGAHTSSAGHPSNALKQGAEIGATGVQFFTANQRQWTSKSYDPQICTDFLKTSKLTNIGVNMSHSSYLINLGSNKTEILTKSRKAFCEEIKRCQSLSLNFMVFHPGSATGSSRVECLDRIAESLMLFEGEIQLGPTQVLIESTAGQGSNVGDEFEDLAYLLKKCPLKNLGICLDTCHMFAAGYELRDESAFEKTMGKFGEIVGFENLKAFHVNDSATPLGSKVDRHALLGEGHMGWEPFRLLMTHSMTKWVPKYLETPGHPDIWKKEIEILRKLEQGASLEELGLKKSQIPINVPNKRASSTTLEKFITGKKKMNSK